MERTVRALSIIQLDMLRNNPRHVTDSVNEATEVLGGMLNTHNCFLYNGVKIQEKMESQPAMKKLGIFQGPRSPSLGDTPKNPAKSEKISAPSPRLVKTAKRGRDGPLPSYVRWPRASPRMKKGTGMWSQRKGEKRYKEKRRKNGEEGGGQCAKSIGDYRRAKLEAPHARPVRRRQKGVGEGRPVVRRHIKENEGEVRPPEGRT